MGSCVDGLWGWGLVGTAGSQGCLAAAAGPEVPKEQSGMCWHLVCAKQVCHPECSIRHGARAEGPQGMEGLRDATWITQHCLPWCGLVNGKLPFRINVFPK